MTSVIRWGIIGPGKIAARLADSFSLVSNAQLTAVASRDIRRAEAFAAAYSIRSVYGSYPQLVNDPEVDIVYVATPHSFHHEQSLLALRHGKAVLCEKPMTLNFRQTSELVQEARGRKVFLMEAMWSRFFPALIKAEELIRNGSVGALRFMSSDFGFAAPYHAEGRVFNPALGGGSWLDVGVYPLFLTLWLMGKPDRLSSFARLSPTGADETVSALLNYTDGRIAHLLSSVVADSPKEAVILCTEGRITLHSAWHKSDRVTLRLNSGKEEVFSFPHAGNGFEYQVRHVTECLQKGLTESPLMTHGLSLAMAEVSDEVRRQCGIRYPAD
jgi:predicted dehydrogenase